MKLKKPNNLQPIGGGIFNSHTLNEILPYLPEEECFFDTRHWVVASLDEALPFAVTTRISSNAQQFLKMYKRTEEPMIAALRGRDTTNPSHRGKSNSNYRQTLETNDSGTSNTITSVQKDNLLVEPQVLRSERTDFGKAIRRDYENGDVQISRHKMTEMKPRTDGVSNTITSVQKDNYLAEPSLHIPEATRKGYAEVNVGGVFDGSYATSKTRRGRVQEDGKITPTITASGEGLNYYEGVDESKKPHFRIRKLTPSECLRLMDVSEEDIVKIMNSGLSNSRIYCAAGNSIVVNVLYHIFRKAFIETESEDGQLSLF